MTEKKRANAIAQFSMQDGVLTWDFGAIGKVTLDPEKVSAVNRARAMTFGLKQRVADAAALSRDPETGASATPEEKFAEMTRMAEHLASGTDQWELRAAGPRDDAASWVSKALVHLGKAANTTEANEKVRKLAEAKFGGEIGKARAALAKATDVAAAILELRTAAQPVGDMDADEMLAGL